ncbi:ABC transporter substrate-binding protein [uncultured Corynebacterium sp.]|mgnify:CR=1 FL=1|uniref:ABC transporter substrate-binding protein n=1 Tax=uncultured Corynebacterium sp. TaxID=159447 RepID=UPI0025FB3926|nr:ABC transporter substrate-binding protein [uncultured Corynebacterium sp.]
MHRHHRRLAQAEAALAAIGSALLLTGCVTNVEAAQPDGWHEITVDAVPEIAALVEDEDGVLTVGSNPPFAPFELKDSTGAIVGVEIDLARAMAQTMGLEFRVVEQDFSMILPALSAGQVDMGVSGFTDNEERRKNYGFVNTLYAGIQWAQRPGHPVDPDNACGLTVAVQRTTVSETDDVRPKSEQCLAEGKDEITVLSYDTADNAALAVLTGRADALSADSPVAAWAVNRADGKMETTGEIFDAAPYGFAVPKDSSLGPAAAAALQHLIDTGVYAEILHQWGIDEGLVEHAMINERPINA